jgi:hypothetical protein
MSEALIAERLDALLRGEAVSWSALGASANEVLDLCARREISELVHQRLLALADTGVDWPDEVRCELGRQAHAAAALELIRGREVAAVLDALAAAGVRAILIKGVPLAYTLYVSPSARPHADTDLFVRRDQVEVAKQIFARLGYEEPALTDGELIFCQFPVTKRDPFGVEHAFDVHWKISTQSVFADLLTYDELSGAAAPVPALGPHAFAAGPVHALLLACVHPVMHHRNADRPIWIYDLHLLASQLSDAAFAAFADLAIGKRVAAICARQLAAACERFGTRVPARAMAALSSLPSDEEPSAVYLQPARRWRHEMASNIRGLPRWTARFRLLREVLFPSARYMARAYRLSRPGLVLLPALYVHRCAYGAWKILVGRK